MFSYTLSIEEDDRLGGICCGLELEVSLTDCPYRHQSQTKIAQYIAEDMLELMNFENFRLHEEWWVLQHRLDLDPVPIDVSSKRAIRSARVTKVLNRMTIGSKLSW